MTAAQAPADIVADRDPGHGLPGRVTLPGSQTQIGPLAHLADERQRLGALSWEHFEARPVAATIGAEIAGVDLSVDLPSAVIGELRRALWQYKVIFFRDQDLTSAQHVAFATRFGDLEVHPFIPSNTGIPELVRFEKDAATGGYENGWHHDVTWREAPSQAAMLRAIHVPPTGGDTLFSDANAAYEGLDEQTKQEIKGLVAIHDYVRAFGRQVPEDKRAAMRQQYPTVEHPVVVAHEATGRPLLYVNRFFLSHIKDRTEDESLELVDRLCRQFETLEYQCRFRWEPNSIAFWDNRAVQHYASSDYFPDRRVMERASIIGTRPIAFDG